MKDSYLLELDSLLELCDNPIMDLQISLEGYLVDNSVLLQLFLRERGVYNWKEMSSSSKRSVGGGYKLY